LFANAKIHDIAVALGVDAHSATRCPIYECERQSIMSDADVDSASTLLLPPSIATSRH
jgi:DNA gyrase/topoisomerase IV subunit B